MDMIAQYIARRFGYVVIGLGYQKEHRTLTRAEALEWVAAYPEGAIVFRQTRRGLRFAAMNRGVAHG